MCFLYIWDDEVPRETINMIELKNCPVCGASSFRDVFKAPYFRGDNEMFQIQECTNCELWVTNPRPSDEDLGSYYDTPDYISHTNAKKGVIDYMYHWVREYSLKKKVALINHLVPDKGQLLDYGAGTGHFLNAAKKQGWQVSGVEPSSDARRVANDKNSLELTDPHEFVWEKQMFDAITLWHVLEHLPDLRGHLSHFSAALKPGGVLVIAVPNHESDDAQKYGANWAALDVPLHLWHFKKRNIQDLSLQFDLNLEEVKNMPFDSFYVSMLSEKIEKGSANYPKAFSRGLKSNLKGKSDNNQSSLIYVLRKPH